MGKLVTFKFQMESFTWQQTLLPETSAVVLQKPTETLKQAVMFSAQAGKHHETTGI